MVLLRAFLFRSIIVRHTKLLGLGIRFRIPCHCPRYHCLASHQKQREGRVPGCGTSRSFPLRNSHPHNHCIHLSHCTFNALASPPPKTNSSDDLYISIHSRTVRGERSTSLYQWYGGNTNTSSSSCLYTSALYDAYVFTDLMMMSYNELMYRIIEYIPLVFMQRPWVRPKGSLLPFVQFSGSVF